MKLFHKIIGIGVAGLLIAVVAAITSIYSGTMLRNNQNEINKYRAFEAELTAAKNAHLQWLRTIDNAIINKKSEIKIGTDGQLCAFGKWYYSDGTEMVKSLPVEFQTRFKNIEKNHLTAHRLGGELIAIWNQEDLQPGIELFTTKIDPTATELIGELTTLEELCHNKAAEVSKQGEWFVANQNLPTLVTIIVGLSILLPYTWFTTRGVVVPMQNGNAMFDCITIKNHTQKTAAIGRVILESSVYKD